MTRPAATASDAIREWAEREPERICFTFHASEEIADRVTCVALAEQASRYARIFRARDLEPGDRVVLLAHSTPGFAAAFLGAQQVGLLPVPCPPPEPMESGRRVRERMSEILRRCGARALVSSEAEFADAALEPPGERRVTVLGPAELATGDVALMAGPARSPFAYCQFTSGSGGRAKGALITHENLAANIRAMAEAYELGTDEAFVTWLPLFHDMGLVAYLLMPLYLRQPAHIMSPLAFLASPGSWLRLITQVRGTISAGPNIAYALCARKVTDAELATLDLSSWRSACNGSEPVTRGAVEAFIRRFEPCGFRPSALLPCYGLAEDTLCATTRRPGEGARFEELSREGIEREGIARPETPGLVAASVGRPLGGHQLAVLGLDGRRLPERRVGEIAISGDSVMHSYLPGTEGDEGPRPDGWLLTGDLGYIADGELFIMGRLKDLIIRAGRNHFPQDIEDALAGVAGVRPGRAAAFSVPGIEREHVVLAAERREEWTGDTAALTAAIRDAVFAAVGIAPDEVLFLARSSLPLTSSGKVMRSEARRLYLEGRWRSG